MTKREFLSSLPDIIHHKTWGYGELEIVADTKDTKGACYRHKDKTASCGSYGSSWDELYFKLYHHLKSEGYIK